MASSSKNCQISGQPKSSPAGSFKQWVLVCRCDEQEPSAELLRQICATCGKQISGVKVLIDLSAEVTSCMSPAAAGIVSEEFNQAWDET